MATTDQGGVWRTINGYHVFIKDGQSASEAIAEQKKLQKEAKTKETENKPKEAITDKPKDPVMQYESEFKLESPVNDFDAAQAYLSDDDMTQYLPDELKEPISSVEWQLDDDETGRVVVKTNRELTEDEAQSLKDWIDGQNSDGLGEGFEQQEFATSYWNPETGEGPFTYREFEQEQERMYDELEPYEYADYLNEDAIEGATENLMEEGGYDVDDPDAWESARQSILDDPEEYLDYEDIAYAKDEYFKDHGGSNEDEWFAMSSMRRNGDDFIETDIRPQVETPEAGNNNFTATELKDKYGTDDVELINAGKETQDRVSLKENEMTEGDWEEYNLEKDINHDAHKGIDETYGMTPEEWKKVDTEHRQKLDSIDEAQRNKVKELNEKYENKEISLKEYIDGSNQAQQEWASEYNKEMARRYPDLMRDYNDNKLYSEETKRAIQEGIDESPYGKVYDNLTTAPDVKAEMQAKGLWEKQEDGSFKANKDAMKAEYEARHKKYDDKIKQFAEDRDNMTNSDWEASIMAYEKQNADGTYKTMDQIMEDVNAYEVQLEKETSGGKLVSGKDEASWVDKNIEKLKKEYKEETGKEPFENGKATHAFAKYNTEKYSNLQNTKSTNQEQLNNAIEEFVKNNPDYENGTYNDDEFLDIADYMDLKDGDDAVDRINDAIYDWEKQNKSKKSSSKSISDNLSRAAYNKYLKEHPGSKITFEDFKKKNK